MTVYAALLRGINVGGHNKIKMADLRKAFEELGLLKVKTYIQSGNVLFESEEDNRHIREKLEDKIKNEFGFEVPVALRTLKELEELIKNCPFPSDALLEEESIHIAFLTELPSDVGIQKLQEVYSGEDQYKIVGKDVYLFFRQSIRNSKLAAQLPKLGVPATVRNWNTVNKLVSMAESL